MTTKALVSVFVLSWFLTFSLSVMPCSAQSHPCDLALRGGEHSHIPGLRAKPNDRRLDASYDTEVDGRRFRVLADAYGRIVVWRLQADVGRLVELIGDPDVLYEGSERYSNVRAGIIPILPNLIMILLPDRSPSGLVRIGDESTGFRLIRYDHRSHRWRVVATVRELYRNKHLEPSLDSFGRSELVAVRPDGKAFALPFRVDGDEWSRSRLNHYAIYIYDEAGKLVRRLRLSDKPESVNWRTHDDIEVSFRERDGTSITVYRPDLSF